MAFTHAVVNKSGQYLAGIVFRGFIDRLKRRAAVAKRSIRDIQQTRIDLKKMFDQI